MDGVFLGGSLFAAFLAGTVALFAPCCITVMFPAYLAAAVRNNRWRLVPLTMVFAAGVALVLVPITLGLSILTESLLRFHTLVYGAGAVLMIVLAGFAATGATWSLPFFRAAPDISRTDSGGVFALGVFSGAASACCAPVLLGVLTLSAVGPGPVAATAIGLAYVFGMVFPLLLLTLLWDRSRLAEAVSRRNRRVEWRLAGRTFSTTRLSMLAAALFAVMAAVLAVVAVTGATLAPSFQEGVSRWVEDRLSPVARIFDPVPDLIMGLALVAIAVGAVIASGRRRGRPESTESDEERNGNDKDLIATDQLDCH